MGCSLSAQNRCPLPDTSKSLINEIYHRQNEPVGFGCFDFVVGKSELEFRGVATLVAYAHAFSIQRVLHKKNACPIKCPINRRFAELPIVRCGSDRCWTCLLLSRLHHINTVYFCTATSVVGMPHPKEPDRKLQIPSAFPEGPNYDTQSKTRPQMTVCCFF